MPIDENLMLAAESSDDAGIYQINDKQAIVQTVDIITPVIDDPYRYGQIAAANSLSDVWAMGGKVITALNIVAYDNCHLTLDNLRDILAGGADKVREAGGVILGGHTIEDPEMKYGLSVTGIVSPDKFIRNNTIKEGDVIILTKPIGLGVITTAIKGEMASEKMIEAATFEMAFLNKYASEIALEVGINAMTDVTGFGLIGHLQEMLNSTHGIELDIDSVPVIDGALEMAEFGMFPAGAYRNETHYSDFCIFHKEKPPAEKMLYFDPQTSGGLLLSVEENKSKELLAKLHDNGIEKAEIIAQVFSDKDKKIIVR